MFPIVDGVKLQKIPYLAYWYWELRPALREIPKVDANDRFCAHFLLSVQDYNHIPMNLAEFLHDLCRAVRKRCHLYVELDDIGVSFDGGFVCGYLQWRGELRSTLEWRDRVSQLWLTDPYGPVYYETNALIVSHDMLKAWHTLVLAAHSFVVPSLLHYNRLMRLFTATCPSLLDADTVFVPV